MAIVSSSYTLGDVQPDGLVRVIEQHTTNLGRVVRVVRFAPVADNHAAKMSVNAATIEINLAEEEFSEVLNGA